MKLKVTRKEIASNFNKIYMIDYKYRFLPDAFACNYGYLGWNWDAYNLGDVCLVEGNRSFPKHKRLPESAKKIIKEYERKVTAATFAEQHKMDKKYLDKFVEALAND